MKKAMMKVILTMMTLVTLLTVIPLSANASTSNKTEVFSYLTKELGFNSAAACGIMANIEKESNFKSGTIIRDSNGLLSGGLCMWNGSRLTNLKNYCSKNGYNYLSIKGQLNFLEHELKSSRYNHIYKYLKNVSNSSGGAYDAAYYWCYYFEVPANRATRAKQRGSAASNTYWKTYGNKTVTKPELSFAKDKASYDLDSSLTLKWTSGGKNADVYKVYVAQKNTKTGKYDWSNAKIYTTTSLKQKISTDYLGAGFYSAYVKAINSATQNSKNSNYLTFTIDCLTHNYSEKVIESPTLTKEGVSSLTCQDCGHKTTGKVDKITYKDFSDYPMTNLKVSDRTNTSITLKWDAYEGVDGYYLYMRVNNEWKLLKTLEGTVCQVINLEPATQYKFAIKAYITHEDKVYKSGISKSYTTATQTNRVTVKTIDGKEDGTATLTWTKEEAATGYAIYVSDNGGKTFKKSVVIKDNNVCEGTVTGLEAGKIYLFRVSTYLDAGDHNVYSEGSNIRLVRIAR
ncbi:MAG: fibronectin type III domain-containing protein [Clostridia bacterium]|nr:fibronectin type III domain-containing protein [Clostridia bacterium]